MDEVKKSIQLITLKYELLQGKPTEQSLLCPSLKAIYDHAENNTTEIQENILKEVTAALQLFQKQDPNARRMSTSTPTSRRPSTLPGRGFVTPRGWVTFYKDDLRLPDDAGFA